MVFTPLLPDDYVKHLFTIADVNTDRRDRRRAVEQQVAAVGYVLNIRWGCRDRQNILALTRSSARVAHGAQRLSPVRDRSGPAGLILFCSCSWEAFAARAGRPVWRRSSGARDLTSSPTAFARAFWPSRWRHSSPRSPITPPLLLRGWRSPLGRSPKLARAPRRLTSRGRSGMSPGTHDLVSTSSSSRSAALPTGEARSVRGARVRRSLACASRLRLAARAAARVDARRLREAVRRAWWTTRYYKALFDEIGFDPRGDSHSTTSRRCRARARGRSSSRPRAGVRHGPAAISGKTRRRLDGRPHGHLAGPRAGLARGGIEYYMRRIGLRGAPARRLSGTPPRSRPVTAR